MFLSRELQARLRPWKVRPSVDTMPTRFAPGTPSFEAQAGTLAAIDHFAWLGTRFGGAADSASLRDRLIAGFAAVAAYEADLMRQFLAGLGTVPRPHPPRHRQRQPARSPRADLHLQRCRP